MTLDRVDAEIRRLGARMDAYDIMRSDASLEEKIAKVRALYDRPGTSGEREAAAAALRRMGVDPDHLSASGSQPRAKTTVSPKRYRVIFDIAGKSFIYTIQASDEISAETAARSLFKREWKSQMGYSAPQWPNGPRVTTSRVN